MFTEQRGGTLTGSRAYIRALRAVFTPDTRSTSLLPGLGSIGTGRPRHRREGGLQIAASPLCTSGHSRAAARPPRQHRRRPGKSRRHKSHLMANTSRPTKGKDGVLREPRAGTAPRPLGSGRPAPAPPRLPPGAAAPSLRDGGRSRRHLPGSDPRPPPPRGSGSAGPGRRGTGRDGAGGRRGMRAGKAAVPRHLAGPRPHPLPVARGWLRAAPGSAIFPAGAAASRRGWLGWLRPRPPHRRSARPGT